MDNNDTTLNCGVFDVTFPLGQAHDCLILMILTVGGTGIPLLLIILILLCALCCMCVLTKRRRRRSGSLGIKLEENISTSHGGDHEVEVELMNVKCDPPTTEQFLDRLYDSVEELNRSSANKTKTVPVNKLPVITSHEAVNASSGELQQEPVPYKEAAVAVSKELPLYSQPEKKQKANGEATSNLNNASGEPEHASMPATARQYDLLHKKEKTDVESSNRQSLSGLPEGMYSSIGEVCPPLPPPLALEDIPIPNQLNEDLASAEDTKEAVERTGRIDEDDQVTRSYTNVTLQQKPVSQRSDQSHRKTEVNYTNTQLSESTDVFALVEDEFEIQQDLYVNI